MRASLRRSIILVAMAWVLILMLAGCGTDKYLVRLDLDPELTKACSKELPVLKDSSDAAGLEWTASMLALYERCANKQSAIVDAINKYNTNVVDANRVKDQQ